MPGEFKVKFWGVRGTIATPGEDTVRYGGNTSCLEVRCGDRLFILDAGSGIRKLGAELVKENSIEAVLMFSHFHWDHIQGFPIFGPFYVPGNSFKIYGERKQTGSMEDLMAGQMSYPYFPVPLGAMKAEMSFHHVSPGDKLTFDDVTVNVSANNHPMGCVAYRFDYGDKSFIYATDTEHYDDIDPVLLEASKDVDVLVYDTNYTDEEYCGKVGFSRVGWGHSTWQEGCKLAEAAGVGQLILFHHDPEHTDDRMDEIERLAKDRFKNSVAAIEGMVLKL